MAFIRTIMGDITPEEFGVCDAHEHLFRAGCKRSSRMV